MEMLGKGMTCNLQESVGLMKFGYTRQNSAQFKIYE